MYLLQPYWMFILSFAIVYALYTQIWMIFQVIIIHQRFGCFLIDVSIISIKFKFKIKIIKWILNAPFAILIYWIYYYNLKYLFGGISLVNNYISRPSNLYFVKIPIFTFLLYFLTIENILVNLNNYNNYCSTSFKILMFIHSNISNSFTLFCLQIEWSVEIDLIKL